MFTQDIRFKALALILAASGTTICRFDIWTPVGGTIGQFVKDLELIALASESEEWLNVVEYLPF